jgi:hypothetical protein
MELRTRVMILNSPTHFLLKVGEQIPRQASSSYSYQSRAPISYQPRPPISYQPSPPIAYQPSPPIAYQPSPVYQRPPYYVTATTLPEAPVFNSAPLVNNQVIATDQTSRDLFYLNSSII